VNVANLQIGDRAIEFELPGVDGEDYSFDDVSEGKEATVVIFMCNHCPYVLAWLERIMAAARDYAEEGVAFVGINANDATKYPADSFEKMQELAQERDLPFPYLRDESQQVARAYGAERTPEIFVFDADLSLRYHGAPDDNYDEELASEPYLRNALEAVLDDGGPAVGETPPVGCTIKWK
jgi:peroxiredoxin